jgi:hypothetical protein
MIVFTKFRDLRDHYPDISEDIRSILPSNNLNEDFMWSLGGDVHIIDTQEEYLHVLKENEGWDIAEERIPGWFLLVNCNNNAGGPSYYIPTAILPEGDRPVSYNA